MGLLSELIMSVELCEYWRIFCFNSRFKKNYGNIYITKKSTILTILSIDFNDINAEHSHYCVTITVIHLQKFLTFSYGNSIFIK